MKTWPDIGYSSHYGQLGGQFYIILKTRVPVRGRTGGTGAVRPGRGQHRTRRDSPAPDYLTTESAARRGPLADAACLGRWARPRRWPLGERQSAWRAGNECLNSLTGLLTPFGPMKPVYLDTPRMVAQRHCGPGCASGTLEDGRRRREDQGHEQSRGPWEQRPSATAVPSPSARAEGGQPERVLAHGR
jgi:hypothetical protein